MGKNLLLFFLIFVTASVHSQCNSSGGTNAGTLVPTTSFQTQSGVDAGEYFIVAADPCKTFTFTFCNNGGSASWDTQITITDLTGTPYAGAYNDDACGTPSQLIWSPTITGNVRVYISRYNCIGSGATGATMAYRATTSGTNTTEYTILGSASSSGTCTTLTPNSTGQTGCAWDVNSTLNFTTTFSYDFVVNLGSSDAGADGMAFVMQNDARGRCACGTTGGALAAGGISNSLIIEIDTYLNYEDRDDGMAGVLCTGGAEPDHLDVWLNGNVNPTGTCPSPAGARVIPNAIKLQSGGVDYNIENGLNHILRISWAPGSPGSITASILNAAGTATYGTVTYAFNPLTVFGTNTPYFGFTGSTGGLSNQQSFCNPLSLLPIDLSRFEVLKENETAHLYWSTESEQNNKHFEIEHSTNGEEWQRLSVIDSKAKGGNSYKALNYDYLHLKPSKGLNYYRLKQVDHDNSYSYSSVRLLNFDAIAQEPVLYPNPTEGSVNISLGQLQGARIIIYNSVGTIITEFDQTSSLQNLNLSDYAAGLYFVSIRSESKDFNYKLQVNKQ